MPLLSIIVPVYNEVSTLSQILDRISAVDLDKEIIVVDDGSSDGTVSLLKQIKSSQIKVIFCPKNRGKGAAFLTGIDAARGRFVIPQDADLIINVGIVEFVPENSGGKSGLAGGGSSASSFMGGLLGEVLNKANMQLNLRIIDRVSSAVISSRDIQSQVVERSGTKIKFPQDKVFKAGLGDYLGTPMGKVFYDCIVEASRYIVQNVPQNYYSTPRS